MQGDFHALRKGFILHFGDAALSSLRVCLDDVDLTWAPLADCVIDSFAATLAENPAIAIGPAFHGTDACNHESICAKGLLVPGTGAGSQLQVRNGQTHGHGIYLSTLQAPWLSSSSNFCTGFQDDICKLFLCAVADCPEARHVKDAFVVSDSNLVAPLVVVTGRRRADRRDLMPLILPAPVVCGQLVKIGQLVSDPLGECLGLLREQRCHPVFGNVTFDELIKLVPPGRLQTTWSQLRKVDEGSGDAGAGHDA